MIIDGDIIKKESVNSPLKFLKGKKFIFLNITKDDDFKEYDIFYILAPEEDEEKEKIKKGF